jgi:hypothetical protein
MVKMEHLQRLVVGEDGYPFIGSSYSFTSFPLTVANYRATENTCIEFTGPLTPALVATRYLQAKTMYSST